MIDDIERDVLRIISGDGERREPPRMPSLVLVGLHRDGDDPLLVRGEARYRVYIGKRHLLRNRHALMAFVRARRPGFDAPALSSIGAHFDALVRDRATSAEHVLNLSIAEMDELLVADLGFFDARVRHWTKADHEMRLPRAARRVLVFLAWQLGFGRCGGLKIIARSRDWQLLALLLEQRAANETVEIDWCKHLSKAIAGLNTETARDLAASLKGLPITSHRALAEEYERITDTKPCLRPSNDIQETMLNHRDPDSGEGLSALCLSGGGIRSASFCLGAIQTLSKSRLFGRFDYLSTVSGGGYIGTGLIRWLTALMDDGLSPGTALDKAEERLSRLANKDYVRNRTTGTRFEHEGPISWLRMHTNYLSRRHSIFSADTWTVVSTYLRNLFIMWLVFWPWIALFLFVPWFSVWLGLAHGANRDWSVWQEALGVALGAIGASYFFPGLGDLLSHPGDRLANPERRRTEGIPYPKDGDNRVALGALLLLSGCFVVAWALPHPHTGLDRELSTPGSYAVLAITLLAVQMLLALARLWPLSYKERRGVVVILAGFLAAAVQGGLIVLVDGRLFEDLHAWSLDLALRALFLPPALFAALIVGEAVKTALRSTADQPGVREHQARGLSFMVMVFTVWMASAPLIVLLPVWLDLQGSSAKGYTAAVSAISLYFTVHYGFRPSTPGKPETRSTRLFTLLGMMGMVLVAVVISIMAWSVIDTPLHRVFISPCKCAGAPVTELAQVRFFLPPNRETCDLPVQQCVDRSASEYVGDVFMRLPLRWLHSVCIFLAISFFVMGALSRLIRMNEFSLHGFYRDRLIRGFYGGFRGEKRKRDAHSFTGFDSNDDIRLSDAARLYGGPREQTGEAGNPPQADCATDGKVLRKPPFLVVNTALNLVKGDALAWQERKADSFTFTPLRAGNYRLGYRPVEFFAGGIKLGTAMAISGAAFNPNMGYNSSAPMAFLMSLFNVRLGWWLGNPAHAEVPALGTWSRALQWLRCKPAGVSWTIKDPTCPARQLLLEAAGQTSDDGPWIHLSDGGHFDNLGLWEMVHRRCRRILIIDASQDRDFTLEDFYTAVRKIRIDMGIEISSCGQPVQLYPRAKRASGLYHACFRIEYEARQLQKGCVSPDFTTSPDVTGSPVFAGSPDCIGSPDFTTSPSDAGGPRETDGYIVYIKPCFYGTEPPDVLEYAERSPMFPHESTADQFFNESQFESYRKLGEHEMAEVLENLNARFDGDGTQPDKRFGGLFPCKDRPPR